MLDEINVLLNYFIFHNINTDEKIRLEVEHYHEKKDITTYILKDHFDYSYCKTCHSAQGLSIDNDITIFDCNISPYVDKNFIYTAITRVRDLKQITIFKHSQYEIERKIISRYILYFKVECDGYLEQDNKFKRPFLIDNYINSDWFITEYEKNDKCKYCHEPLEYELVDNNVYSNITANRINNMVGHEIDNCEICCIDCNRKIKILII